MIDSTGLGLHHVLAQTLVRVAGAGHGAANAALLPHTIGALARRAPEAVAALEAAVTGSGAAQADIARENDLAGLALRIAERANASGLRAIGVDPADLPACADAAAARPQLANTPPAAGRDEILALYEAAL